jgi:hypothetical protein
MDMKIKKSILIAVITLFCLVALSGCNYAELPPKTDDVTYDFVLPKGEVPSASELETLHLIRDEYNNSLK